MRLAELPALRSVSFWAADISISALEALLEISELAELDVSNTSLNDDAAAVIGRMAGLQRLSASSHFSRAGLQHLQQLSHLNCLDLYHRPESDGTEEEARRMFSHVKEVTVFAAGSL